MGVDREKHHGVTAIHHSQKGRKIRDLQGRGYPPNGRHKRAQWGRRYGERVTQTGFGVRASSLVLQIDTRTELKGVGEIPDASGLREKRMRKLGFIRSYGWVAAWSGKV